MNLGAKPPLRCCAIPTFAAIVGDQLQGVADTIVNCTLGPAALAAVIGAATVFTVIVLTVYGMNEGADILGAQAIGAGDCERFGRIMRASSVVPFSLGLAVIVAALVFAQPAMRTLVGSLPTVYAGAKCLSLHWCLAHSASLAATPLALLMLTLPLKGYAMVAIARVRAAGDTRFSMLVGVIASVIVVPGTWFAAHLRTPNCSPSRPPGSLRGSFGARRQRYVYVVLIGTLAGLPHKRFKAATAKDPYQKRESNVRADSARTAMSVRRAIRNVNHPVQKPLHRAARRHP